VRLVLQPALIVLVDGSRNLGVVEHLVRSPRQLSRQLAVEVGEALGQVTQNQVGLLQGLGPAAAQKAQGLDLHPLLPDVDQPLVGALDLLLGADVVDVLELLDGSQEGVVLGVRLLVQLRLLDEERRLVLDFGGQGLGADLAGGLAEHARAHGPVGGPFGGGRGDVHLARAQVEDVDGRPHLVRSAGRAQSLAGGIAKLFSCLGSVKSELRSAKNLSVFIS